LGVVQPELELRGRTRDLLSVASAQLNTMGVSVEWFGAIAAELGISRPALYNYVRERSDLQFKCYIRTCDALDAALVAAGRARTPASVIESFLQQTNVSAAPETAVLCEIDALTPERQQIVRQRRDGVVSRIATTVRRGMRDGSFRRVDPIIVANAIVGMANWTAIETRWGSNPDLVLSVKGIGEILFKGIAQDRSATLQRPNQFAQPKSATIDVFDRQSLEGARREAILVAASGLFNRRGVGATRIEDVAAHLNLNKRTIYHLAGQKQVLVEACVERAYDFYLSVMDGAEKAKCTRLEAMYGGLRDVIEIANAPESAVLVPYVGFGQLSAAGRKKAITFSRKLFAGYERILIAGERERSIRRLPHDQILNSLPGVFSWVSNMRIMTAEERARVAHELATLAIFGLLA
jgi:AcrR family transcriptional regulator